VTDDERQKVKDRWQTKNYGRRTYYGAALKVNPAKAREARRMRRACGGAFGREDIKSKDLMHFGTSKIPRPEAVA
jgi:hypothetical protein